MQSIHQESSLMSKPYKFIDDYPDWAEDEEIEFRLEDEEEEFII